METKLYKITLEDGSIFKVFCANRNQMERVEKVYQKLNVKQELDTIDIGIHTVKQFEEIMAIINQQNIQNAEKQKK